MYDSIRDIAAPVEGLTNDPRELHLMQGIFLKLILIQKQLFRSIIGTLLTIVIQTGLEERKSQKIIAQTEALQGLSVQPSHEPALNQLVLVKQHYRVILGSFWSSAEEKEGAY